MEFAGLPDSSRSTEKPFTQSDWPWRIRCANSTPTRMFWSAWTRGNPAPRSAAVLTLGLRQGGSEATSAGVIPTPGVAYLARMRGFSAGVVISASHNPWQDNGIKIFGGDGYKLADPVELAIEDEIFARISESREPEISSTTAPEVDPTLPAAYIEFLRSQVPDLKLDGKRIVVDCANGAASAIAPRLLAHFGGDVQLTHVSPNGRNINDHCGALHPEVVAQEVVTRKAGVGITFDGDADRAMLADEHGKVVNGDSVLLIAARDLHAQKRLAKNLVVATTMSNMGLEAALRSDGIKMLRAPVGDKYVLEEMQKHGAVLGGEQSGHMLFSGSKHHRRWHADSFDRAGYSAAFRPTAFRSNKRPEGFPAGDCECSRAGEAAPRGNSNCRCRDSRRRNRTTWQRPRGDSLFRNRGPGASHDRGGI